MKHLNGIASKIIVKMTWMKLAGVIAFVASCCVINNYTK